MQRVTMAELEQQAPASEPESRLLSDLSLVTSSSGPIVWKLSELAPVFAN
jgi:hypothetical protein